MLVGTRLTCFDAVFALIEFLSGQSISKGSKRARLTMDAGKDAKEPMKKRMFHLIHFLYPNEVYNVICLGELVPANDKQSLNQQDQATLEKFDKLLTFLKANGALIISKPEYLTSSSMFLRLFTARHEEEGHEASQTLERRAVEKIFPMLARQAWLEVRISFIGGY